MAIDVAGCLPTGTSHPRDDIHGALLLFRQPKDTAALCYELKGIVVWNNVLVTETLAEPVAQQIRQFLPYPLR